MSNWVGLQIWQQKAGSACSLEGVAQPVDLGGQSKFGGKTMTKEKAREVIMRTLESVDKAVGIVGIRESQHICGYVVDLMKHGKDFRVTIDEIILMEAEAHLMEHSSGSEGDKGLGDLKKQLTQAISEETSP